MGYAVRKDGQGWRAVNSIDDVDAVNETFSETQHVKSEAELLKERTNTSIQAQINALEAQIPPLMRHYVVRPNAPMARPSGPPKTPAQAIADLDTQIESLKATLIP